MIRLEPVTEETFRKVVDMKLPPEQNCFVAPNVVSLAQAWLYYDETRPFAVMDDDKVVGFLMLDWDENERTIGVWRFMIAPEHQKMGYGRKAMEAMLQMIKKDGKFDLAHLDYVKGNTVARDLYYSLGFRETGDEEDGEIIMTLKLTDTPKVGMTTADEEDLDEIFEMLEEERKEGYIVPEPFDDEAVLKGLVAKRSVKRLTIYGEPVGLVKEGTMFLQKKNERYRKEAEALIRRK